MKQDRATTFSLQCAIRRMLFAGLLMACAVSRAADPATAPASQPTTDSGPLHLPNMPLHDPFILAYAPTRTYYLYTSNNPRISGIKKSGIMAYSSKDLLAWTRPSVVFTVPDNIWADPARTPWAPEVDEYQGKFYLLTTLHNEKKIIAQPPDVWRTTYMRGTTIAVSDSPTGPFTLIKTDGPIPPANFMTLDGTLYLDPVGTPWMVYAHEWIQKIDGTMEAIRLKPDLTASVGDPLYLFKASDAPWINQQAAASVKQAQYVTDGPEMFRTRDGHLLMLWSSYETAGYVQTIARSKSGKLEGPWEQLPPLLKNDSGHGMLFHRFDGQLMLVLHHPFRGARGKLFEIRDAGDHLEIMRERTDLDGAGDSRKVLFFDMSSPVIYVLHVG